ncbi:MAG: flagellar biosynthesis anti-sigma factor FlgM [Nitrospirae bacterium]|nr:flagellar biosynthesis anti-sigma factor FlgM [Nitrospirota bacterium]
MAALLLGVQESDRLSAKRQAGSAPKQDQVDISDQAKEIQRIKELVAAPDGARAQHVEQLRQAIDAGTADISGRTVADALIRQVLTDAVLF